MQNLLSIPAEDQSAALALGAMLDPNSGKFFAPPGVDLAAFRAWLPSQLDQLNALVIPTRGLSLTELLNRVTAAIDHAFPRAEWVRIEISSLASRNGHVYLDAVDRNEVGKELSKSRANIWRGQAEKLGKKFFQATGTHLADGMKVLVLVEPKFKPQYGLSLNIIDIDPSFTLGDMEARLKRIREKLYADGDADKNRHLPAPADFTNVAVISPNGAAGLGDFQAEADRLAQAGLCAFTYFHAVFQGEKAKDSLKDAFIGAHKTHEIDPFDVLVIIRGGGATADLQWLNEYLLAKMVCRFHAPVFTGIGHERDSTILDEYAHKSFGTPSKVIAHIKEVIATRANKALEDWTAICQAVSSRLTAAAARIDRHHSDIASGAWRHIDQANFATEKSHTEVHHNAQAVLALAAEKIEGLHTSVVDGASTRLDAAITDIDHISATINERALSTIANIDTNAAHHFDAVTLAARRSIDGIDEHLTAYWLGILDNTLGVANQRAAESDRNFNDVQYYVKKTLEYAEESARELMTSTLAHGIEPTLKRGFAIVKTNGKPISTRAAAAAHNELEIMFKDGSLRVTPQGE